MNKILSVIIPSYNTEKYINECVRTFLDIRIIEKIEILIINDGSVDKTAEYAKTLENLYPNCVRHIYKENGGHGSTINCGIKEAKGRYVRVVDGDDWVNTDEFVNYVNNLDRIDADVVITPFDRVVDGKDERINIRLGIKEGYYELKNIIKDLGEKYALHSLTFKTDILKRIRKITENCFYVDQEYIVYPLVYVKNAYVCDCVVYQYRIGLNEQSMSKESKIKNRNMHKKVIYELIKFKEKSKFCIEIDDFLNDKISKMSSIQAEIYLSMDEKKVAKNECRLFFNTMKKIGKKYYDGMPGKKVKLLKQSNLRLFGVLHSVNVIKNRIK